MNNRIVRNKYLFIFLASGALIYFLLQPAKSNLQTAPVNQPKDLSLPFPVRRAESPEKWQRDGEAFIERIKNKKTYGTSAKNVILFVGDGMGITTLTASRILEGQMRGESGEENQLSFEEFPSVALSKTYSVNQQTSDSAPTMTAIIAGVKTDEGILSVNQSVVRQDWRTVKGNETKTLLEMAEERGLSTGIVTTARLTHATPGACYAHTADRDWESDAELSADARRNNFPDIARQLIEFSAGDGGSRARRRAHEIYFRASERPGIYRQKRRKIGRARFAVGVDDEIPKFELRLEQTTIRRD